jgi:acetyl esterase/lipase
VSLEVDGEFAPILEAVAEMRAATGVAPPADALAIRAESDAGLAFLADLFPAPEGLREESFTATGADGAPIELRWCTTAAAPADAAPGPAVVYLHGGGMILGTADLFAPVVRGHVHATGVPFLAVDYRLAPEHPHPTPVEDCLAGLRWLHEHHEELGVDASRIAVMGESAGGGLAAGVALLARDRAVPLARQILVYPMLDDTNTVPDPALVPYCASWSYGSNAIGWRALLGDAVGGADVPAAAAPARATDLSGVAPAYVEVGMLDIFRDEDIDYARRMAAAGVSVELHVHPGVPHGFEMMAPHAEVSQRAVADRRRVIQSL